MPDFTVIAFYTKDTPYEKEAQELIRNCQSFGIPIETVGYPNTGSWVRNAALKSIFISSMMEKHPRGARLVYLDVDARIRQYPELFDTLQADIGVHYRKKRSSRSELLSGTIYIRNTKYTHSLVKAWIKKQSENPDTWDQRILQATLEETPNIRRANLPATYTQIFDSMRLEGKPVIEHMQASRRYRDVVQNLGYQDPDIPDVIGRSRVRRGDDGTYYLIRPDPAAEKFLDENCIRKRNELRWYPKIYAEADTQALHKYFCGKTCYIVGKGPSLDHLRAEHFGPGPVIALNEAVHTVEALGLSNQVMCLQQDAKLKDTCKPKRGGKMLVSIKAANFYAAYPGLYIFDSRRYGLSLNSLSVSAAIRIALSLDAKKFTLLCFDASVSQTLGYAKAISYDSTWGGNPKRFLSHRAKILRNLGACPVEWVIPQSLDSSVADGRPRL